MPVQPTISIEQVIITILFLTMLFVLMWVIKRYRGGISSRLYPARRMQHIEDLALGPQQRLHLIEVDGCTFLVHAGKGHAASFQPVEGTPAILKDVAVASRDKKSATASDQIPDVTKHRARKAAVKPAASKPAPPQPAPEAQAAAPKPKSAFAAAIAQARRNNPSLGFDK